jgi:hypothetical protein
LIVAYFKAPDAIGGIHTVYARYQIMPFFIFPFWLASIEFSKLIKTLIAVITMVLIVGLMTVRIPVHKLCSETIEEYVSIEKYIPANSTVIPLSYTTNGKTPDGKTIADRTWIFFHGADYLGVGKPLIMMGNYEAHTDYFPLRWIGEVNPFTYLSEGSGIEGIPPQINIERYEKETPYKVDYVLLLSLDQEYINHPNTISLFKQLQANYTRIT